MATAARMNYGKAGGVAAIAAIVIGAIFQVEKGYVDNPNDPGGATNHGVTVAVARKHGYEGHMRGLPKNMAYDIYVKDYIKAPGYEPLLALSPALAHKVIDGGVNAGTGRSSRWFQQSLNALNRNGTDYRDIAVDGKVGAGTIGAYKSLVNKRGKFEACSMMIKLMDVHQGMHYLSLTNLETFTPGWVSHRIGNVSTADCDQ